MATAAAYDPWCEPMGYVPDEEEALVNAPLPEPFAAHVAVVWAKHEPTQAVRLLNQLVGREPTDLGALAALSHAWFGPGFGAEQEAGFQLLLQADSRGFRPGVELAKAIGARVLPVPHKHPEAAYYLLQTPEQKRYIASVQAGVIEEVRHVQTGALIRKSPLMNAVIGDGGGSSKLCLRNGVTLTVVQSGLLKARA